MKNALTIIILVSLISTVFSVDIVTSLSGGRWISNPSTINECKFFVPYSMGADIEAIRPYEEIDILHIILSFPEIKMEEFASVHVLPVVGIAPEISSSATWPQICEAEIDTEGVSGLIFPDEREIILDALHLSSRVRNDDLLSGFTVKVDGATIDSKDDISFQIFAKYLKKE
jgi:hypothetical protein